MLVVWVHLVANTAASYRKRTRVPVRGGAPRGTRDDSSSLMGRPRSKHCRYSRPFRLRRASHLVLPPLSCKFCDGNKSGVYGSVRGIDCT